MALWVCGGEVGCGTKYAVGLSRCPRCHNTEFFEDGDPMAKITRHGGASDHTVPAPDEEAEAVDAQAPEAEEAPAAVPEPEEEEGGEESSPGSSSSASTETPEQNSEPSSKPIPKRARTTGSRSRKAQTETSSVDGTDGAPETGTSAADGTED
jgi:hypothetical protein